MPFIRNGQLVDDLWRTLADDEDLPAEGLVIISLERWRNEGRDLARGRAVGVLLESSDQASDIATDLDRLALVAVSFPAIGDGRGYTIGRLLRERYGFEGELRAVGPIVRDVFGFLQRAGFDAVEARDEAEAAAWDEAVSAITVTFQPVGRGFRAAQAAAE